MKRLRWVGPAVFAVAAVGLIWGGYALGYFGGAPKNANSSAVNLDKGLVGWWKMDGNAKDSTPRALDLTVSGTAALTTDREGKSSSAYAFDGTSSCLNRSASGGLSLTGAMSVSAWLKISGSSTIQNIVRSGLVADETYALYYNGTSKYVGFSWYDGAFKSIVTSNNTAQLNTWNHAVITRDAVNNVTIYINGSQSTTGTATTPTVGASSLSIGATICNTNQQVTGSIDDVRVYNRVLSAAEVSAMYNQYGSGIKADVGSNQLVGWWKLDGNTKDSSPLANDGTNNAASLTTDREGLANSAYSFNGTSSYIRIGGQTSLGTSNQPYTITGWVKPTASSGTIVHMSSLSNGTGWCLPPVGISSSKLVASSWNGGLVQATGATTLSMGQWYFFANTWDATNGLRIYLNGSLDGSTAMATYSASGTSNYLHLGYNSGGCAGALGYYTGSIDDVRAFKRSLSSTEIAAMYSGYNPAVKLSDLQKGLILDLPFNGNRKDATPYARSASVGGSPALTTDRKGRSNSAYSFNGTTDYFYEPASILPTQAITVSLWAYQTTWANWYDLIPNNWCGVGGWNMFTDTGGQTVFGVSQSGCAQYNALCGAASFTLNTWHHLVGTYDGSTVKLYLDGSVCGTTASLSSATLSTTGNVVIGDYGGTVAHSIDDVRIWNRALSAAEVARLYATYR